MDGIFAVAMTILVLELHVPTLVQEVTNQALDAALWRLLPKMLCYLSGFVILGTLWVAHHYQFHYIRRSNRTLLWINLVFLLTISFLPFVVALIGTYGALPTPCILYGATLMVAGTCLLAQWQYAAGRGRRLVPHGMMTTAAFTAIRARILAGMVGYGSGLALAFVAPRLSLVCYAAMPLIYLIPGRIDRHLIARE